MLPSVLVHPTAVMSALNSYMRRTDRGARVIGTLMGMIREGRVEVTDAYAVPHSEKPDEQYVAINKDYHKSMLSARRMINRREVIVGWWSTSSPDGRAIIDNSSLIHDFYMKECADPVHLVLDTTLTGDSLEVRAFVSAPMSAGPYTFANVFHEVRADIELAPHELVCIDQMNKGQRYLGVPWSGPSVVSALPSEARALTESTERLLQLLDKVLGYVDSVVEGKQPAHADIGMALADTLGTAQGLRLEEVQAALQSRSQDLLMVSYLSTMLQTQLAVAERLNQII